MYASNHINPRGFDPRASNMSISVSAISEQDRRLPLDDDCPDYEAVVNKNPNTHYLNPHDDRTPMPRSLKGVSITSSDRHLPSSSPRRNPRPLPRHERYIYTYRLLANATPLDFMISVEPECGKPRPGKYTFRLSFKANGIERSLGEPTTRTLRLDPRELNFVVFMFPGKSGSLPAGSLWSLRVWLRVPNVDHRLFGEDDLWVAKDPDFNSIGDASFARLRTLDSKEQVYHGYVGKALATFNVRWECVSNKLYKYSLKYEAGGVGDTLFEDFQLQVDGDPRAVTFLIYTVPSVSIPTGAAHKLRVWIRSLVPLSASDPSSSYVLPFNDSYIYQRIWKCDSFKIGGRLDFESLGAKMIMGFSSGVAETIVMPNPPPLDIRRDGHRPSPSQSSSMDKRDYDF